MKKLWCAVFTIGMLALCNNSSGQLLEKIKNKAKGRADQKVDQTIEKGMDEAEGKNKKAKSEEQAEVKEKNDEAGTKTNSQGLKAYSKYDFVPGDKIVYAEDFSQDAIGEFPLKWNTNGTGEIVTLEGIPGKWLKITESTKYESAYNNKLPENYTIEFDVLVEFKDDQSVPYVKIQLEADKVDQYPNPPVVEISLAPNGGINVEGSGDGIYYETRNEKNYTTFEGKKQLFHTFSANNHKNIPVHVSLWIQKQRIRVWINQDKLYDLPKGIAENMNVKKLSFETTNYGGPPANYSYFISNIKIAEALPDTRSKLITEGKWSTTGILFDVNSDKIKPSSYGTLKQIAATLSENPDLKIKIIEGN